MWNAIAICTALTLSAPERVTFETADGLTLAADFFDLAGDTPTVICLPMLRSTRDSYAPIQAPFREAGLQVLALDLRGHGESAPELAPKVAERDEELFKAMYQDVEAALAFLRARGEDTSRVSLLGASVGCSVGIDAIVRDPSAFRSIAVMTPGAKYLGIDTLEQLQRWPDVPALVLSSTEEQAKVNLVAELLLEDAHEVTDYTIYEGGGMHGTRMFGKVPGVEAKLVDFYRETLLNPALAIPRFDADDPRVETAGFVARTLRLSRSRKVKDEERRFTLMVFAVGDTLTVGAMTKQAFVGSVQLELGGRVLAATWDTDVKGPVAFTSAGDAPLELVGAPGAFRGTHWVNLELPISEWMPEGEQTLRLTFMPQEGKPMALPGGAAPFHAYLAER